MSQPHDGTRRAAAAPGGRSPAAPAALAAVLFDMDGVVTDTARAHAAAWKRLFDDFLARRAGQPSGFMPFDEEDDYREHVDGKPRYDGVESFLRSRAIDLPYGHPEDPPDAETICGLGNRKNGYFRDWLAHNRVRTYPSTITLIERLRKRGMGVAVFSASRNCQAVLDNAGIGDLFDARVDGTDLARLGLPGKPDPAMLLEAAKRLDAPAERAGVVEDSVAGVRAGALGSFRCVVGVDRGDYGDRLAESGADIVVHDLGEIMLGEDAGLTIKRLDSLPSAREHLGDIRARLANAVPALFLDYDGTLSPIVADPATAHLSADVRNTLATLAQRWPVAIISGRALDDLRERVGLENLAYAGSHGFEMAAPGFSESAEGAAEYLPALDAAERTLRERLAGIPGHLIERKPFTIAVHYRQVNDEDVATVVRVVEDVEKSERRLRRSHGKKVIELHPGIDWHKGEAVLRLLKRLGLERNDVAPIYIGDDITDEDVFRVLIGRGICIAVGDEARPTSADYGLAGPDDVARFLEALQGPEGSPA